MSSSKTAFMSRSISLKKRPQGVNGYPDPCNLPCVVNACVSWRVKVPPGKGRLPSSHRSGERGNEFVGAFDQLLDAQAVGARLEVQRSCVFYLDGVKSFRRRYSSTTFPRSVMPLAGCAFFGSAQ